MLRRPIAWVNDPLVGSLTLRLLRNPDWIRRRVETVRFEDAVTLERRVTVDVCIESLRAAVAELDGAEPPPDREVLVPLAVLRKGLLLDLDVRDDTGRPLHIVTRDIDAIAGREALLAELRSGGVSTLDPVVVETLYEIVHEFPSDDDVRRLDPSEPDSGPIDHWSLVDVPDTPDVAREWRDLIETRTNFRTLLVNLTLNFMLMTPILLDGHTRILKFRYLDATVPPPDMTVRERLGLAPYGTLVAMPAVGWAAREHLRVDAPPGLFIESAHLIEFRDDEADQVPKPPDGSAVYEKRIGKNRAAVYTARARRGNHYLAVDLRPPVDGFLRASRLTVLLTFSLLAAGAVMQLVDRRLDAAGGNADAAVAVLLIVPSLLSAYLVRAGEHDLLSNVLRGPRYAIAASSLAPLAAGGLLALGFRGIALAVAWSVLAGSCLAVVGLLSVVMARSGRAADDVDDHSTQTWPDEVLALPRPTAGR